MPSCTVVTTAFAASPIAPTTATSRSSAARPRWLRRGGRTNCGRAGAGGTNSGSGASGAATAASAGIGAGARTGSTVASRSFASGSSSISRPNAS